ncbi:MAG: hypothetical protein KDK51_02855 [Deltaproteobacteria bacterium]|nr:hypothetical protein [Deltaproteobacteria bacterium]
MMWFYLKKNLFWSVCALWFVWAGAAHGSTGKPDTLFRTLVDAVIAGNLDQVKTAVAQLQIYNKTQVYSGCQNCFTLHSSIGLTFDSQDTVKSYQDGDIVEIKENPEQLPARYQGKSPLMIALQTEKSRQQYMDEFGALDGFVKADQATVAGDPFYAIFMYLLSHATAPGQMSDQERVNRGLFLLDLNQGFTVLEPWQEKQSYVVRRGRTLLMQALIASKHSRHCHSDVESAQSKIPGLIPTKCSVWEKLAAMRDRYVNVDGQKLYLIDHFDINQGDAVGKNVLTYAITTSNCPANLDPINSFFRYFLTTMSSLKRDGENRAFIGYYKPNFYLGDVHGDTPLMYFVGQCIHTYSELMTEFSLEKIQQFAVSKIALGLNPFQRNLNGLALEDFVSHDIPNQGLFTRSLLQKLIENFKDDFYKTFHSKQENTISNITKEIDRASRTLKKVTEDGFSTQGLTIDRLESYIKNLQAAQSGLELVFED